MVSGASPETIQKPCLSTALAFVYLSTLWFLYICNSDDLLYISVRHDYKRNNVTILNGEEKSAF